MKITIGAGASTSGTFTIDPRHCSATELRVTDEQIARVWNRPLSEIRRRLGAAKTEAEIERVCRWIVKGGPTEAARARTGATE